MSNYLRAGDRSLPTPAATVSATAARSSLISELRAFRAAHTPDLTPAPTFALAR